MTLLTKSEGYKLSVMGILLTKTSNRSSNLTELKIRALHTARGNCHMH